MKNDISYRIEYEELDKHWLVIKETENQGRLDHVAMRFPARGQAERFVESKTAAWSDENNSEKEG